MGAAEIRPSGASTPALTVVVPTFNERDNVAALVERLDAALSGVSWAVLFVDDDSPDGTADRVRELGAGDPRVKCLLRVGRRGLASACIEGMVAASSPYLAVMDADLQHDETVLPRMLAALETDRADVAVGSRYADAGGTGEWGRGRALASRAATALARLVVPKTVTDPMSGFFVIRREAFLGVVRKLSGRGFKILLDILASADPPFAVTEVPYTFRPRRAGESKLSGAVAWDYLELLLEKSVGRIVPVRFAMFVAVGATGVVVHMAALGALHRLAAVAFGVSQALAIAAAMTSNFFLNNLITYRDRPLKGGRLVTGLLTFYAACAIGAVINLALAVFLDDRGLHWALAGFSGAVAGAVWNFATTAVVTWRDIDGGRDGA